MATLTGFEVVSSTDDLKNGTKLRQSTSPFKDNVQFIVNGFAFVKPCYDGKIKEDVQPQPVLTTSIPNGYLFVKSLNRPVVDIDNKILEHDGAFNKRVADIIANPAFNTDEQILNAIVADCANKTLVVRRRPYVKLTTDNRKFPTSLVEIDYKQQLAVNLNR